MDEELTTVKQHAFNLDNLDPSTVPSAPLGAFDPADWHDVPEGYYLLPVHDWNKFGDDCGRGDETPDLDLLGFRVFVRQTPTLIKKGKRVGQAIGRDAFHVGQLVLARGVQERIINRREKVDGPVVEVIRYTPSERLKREADGDRWAAEHDSWSDGDTPCDCHDCHGINLWKGRPLWTPAPDQANAYRNEVAGALLHYIKKENDVLRALYGQLTGHCGVCGRFIYEPESKRLGIGPDCRGAQ